MARFVSINRLERGEPRELAEVEAIQEESPRGRRWRVEPQRGRGRGPAYFPDHIFQELFAPVDARPFAVITHDTAHLPN